MNIPYPVIEVTGWLAVLLYVLAYFLLSTNKLSAHSYTFHLLNILGAIGLIINALYYSDRANLVVNVIWFAIGAVVILRKLLGPGKDSESE